MSRQRMHGSVCIPTHIFGFELLWSGTCANIFRGVGEEAEGEAANSGSEIDFEKLLLDYRKGPIDIRIYSSQLFEGCSDIGVFDLYKTSTAAFESQQIIDLTLPGDSTVSDAQEKLVGLAGSIKNPRQCLLFRFDPLHGPLSRPTKRLAESSTLAGMKLVFPEMHFWLHVVPSDSWEESALRLTLPSVSEAGAVVQPPAVTSTPLPADETSESTSNSQVPGGEDGSSSNLEGTGSNGPSLALDGDGQQPSQPQVVDPTPSEDTLMLDVSEPVPGAREAETDRSVDAMDIEPSGPTDTANPITPTRQELGALVIVTEDEDMPVRAVEEAASHGPKNVYFLLKHFDLRRQTLRAVGSFLAKADDIVSQAVRRLLELPDDHAIRLLEECEVDDTRSLGVEKSFRDLGLSDGRIIVVQDRLSDKE